MYFGVGVGDEEDHDNDRGRWEGAGGPLIHASLPQVCPTVIPTIEYDYTQQLAITSA